MAIDFKRYPSLVNHDFVPSQRFIKDAGWLDKQYYRLEKVHGTNFVVGFTNKEYQVGRRNGWIDLEDPNVEKTNLLLAEHASGLVLSYGYDGGRGNFMDKILTYLEGEYNTAYVYGEYYGYKVQKMKYEINELRETDIKIFSLILTGDNVNPFHIGMSELSKFVEERFLLSVNQGADESGNKTLREWLNSELDLNSELGGVAEGAVYFPADNFEIVRFTDVDGNIQQQFPVIKHKSDAFREVERSIKSRDKMEFPQEVQELINELTPYVTKNRLRNVLSHGGYEQSPKGIGKIMQGMKSDIQKEYFFHHPDKIGKFEKAEIRQAMKSFDNQIRAMIIELINEITEE